MEDADRDELLGRLDERSAHAATDLAEMKEWQKEQNGDILALKQWQAKLTGAFGVLAVVVVLFQAEIVGVVADLWR